METIILVFTRTLEQLAKAVTVVLDIAAIIHMSQPTADLQQKHYLIDYVPMHLVPYLESQLTPQLSHQVITDDAR